MNTHLQLPSGGNAEDLSHDEEGQSLVSSTKGGHRKKRSIDLGRKGSFVVSDGDEHERTQLEELMNRPQPQIP